MINKTVRLAKALYSETAKRLPVILVLLAALLLWQSYIDGQRANLTLSKINQQGQQIKDLSLDNKRLSQQNKELGQQNKDLSEKGNAHIDCIASLFAKWTRDGRPILSTDLDTCAVVSGSAPQRTETEPAVSQKPPQSSVPAPTPAPPPAPTIPQKVGKFVSNLVGGVLKKIKL